MKSVVERDGVFKPNHYTSANCMTFYKRYAKKGCSVLDVGTGTGILAIKAKKYGAGRVLAVDIQPEAVECAKENCKSLDIEVRENYLNWDIDEQFDVTIANLYSNPAFEFLQYADRTMKDDGILILTWHSEISWFYIEDWFDIIEGTEGLEYNTYVLQKKGGTDERYHT